MVTEELIDWNADLTGVVAAVFQEHGRADRTGSVELGTDVAIKTPLRLLYAGCTAGPLGLAQE